MYMFVADWKRFVSVELVELYVNVYGMYIHHVCDIINQIYYCVHGWILYIVIIISVISKAMDLQIKDGIM